MTSCELLDISVLIACDIDSPIKAGSQSTADLRRLIKDTDVVSEKKRRSEDNDECRQNEIRVQSLKQKRIRFTQPAVVLRIHSPMYSVISSAISNTGL